MKKFLVYIVMAIMLISVTSVAFADYGSDDNNKGSNSGSDDSSNKGSNSKEPVKMSKDRLTFEKRGKFGAMGIHDKLRELHDERETALEGLPELKQLKDRYRKGEAGGDLLDKYRHALINQMNFLKRIAEYIQEKAPEDSPKADAMLERVNAAIAKLEALPNPPTKEEFRSAMATVKEVKKLIHDIKQEFNHHRDEHRTTKKGEILGLLKHVHGVLGKEYGEDSVNRCKSLVDSEQVKAAFECYRSVRDQNE